jgi:4-hydroxy-tetrahydrodipicolinate synthase
VFQTPFHDDDSINYDTLGREIQWLFDQGADGIVLAMVSEVLRLSTEERQELAQFACRVGRERGVVVISVGSESCHTSQMLARHAEQCGADAVMAIPPLTALLSERQTESYYESILEASSLPVIVQDASGYVGRPMSIDLQARLYNRYPGRVLFKPEAHPIGPRLSELHAATGGTAGVFEGSGGAALIDTYGRGVRGTMPGADLIQPLVALWRALTSGDEQRAWRIALPLGCLATLQPSLEAYLAVEKYLLVKQGVFESARVRPPAGFELDEPTRRQIDRLFNLLLAAAEPSS